MMRLRCGNGPGSGWSGRAARHTPACGWAPTLDDAAALALHWARPGDVVVTLGVGEPWRIARAIVEGLPG